jgi:hypothetical protein
MHANFEFYIVCPAEFQDKLRDSYEIDFNILPDGYYSL